jgi:RNA polymerase sigma-70 factor (ECF subfamily)
MRTAASPARLPSSSFRSTAVGLPAHPAAPTVRGSMDDAASRMALDRERTLVSRVRGQADSDAFEELYRFYLPRIYGFIFRRVREHSTAEDLTSTTFQRALEAMADPGFRNETLGGWLYRVAANAVIDHFRAGRRQVSMEAAYPDAKSGGPADPRDHAADALAAAADRDEVRRALSVLSAGHRAVLVLRFYDQLDNTEMCAVLGCSRPVLALRLHRAIRAMRLAIARGSSDVA